MHYAFKVILLSLFVLELVAKISIIDEPRKPITKSDMVVWTIINGLVFWGLVVWL